VVVPVNHSFARAPAHLSYPGSKGRNTVVRSTAAVFPYYTVFSNGQILVVKESAQVTDCIVLI